MAAPTYVNGATGTTSATLGATAASDILIATFASVNPTPGGTYSGGAWTLVKGTLLANGLYTYWSRATGNHSGQTVTGAGVTGMLVEVYRGCLSTASPIDTNTSEAGTNAGTGLAPASFNTTVVDTLTVFCMGGNDTATPGTWSAQTRGGSAMTERHDANDVAIADLSLAATGATGAFSATHSTSGIARDGHAFALKPVALPLAPRGRVVSQATTRAAVWCKGILVPDLWVPA